MSHFSHPCMHMVARAYANEMLMRLGRSLEQKFEFDYFRITTQPFLMCFKETIFRLKLYNIVTIYLVSRTDLIHMLRDSTFFAKNRF